MLCFVICNQKDDKAESDNKNTTPPHVLLYFSRHTGCRHKKYLHVLLVFEGRGVLFRLELQKGLDSFSLNYLVQKVFSSFNLILPYKKELI